MNCKLLIVDDHKQVLKALIQLLEPDESITGTSNPNQIISYINNKEFDVILLAMNFSAGVNNGNEGIYWLNRILKSNPLATVVMITAYSDVNLAVRAIKEGATDFVIKPWDNNKLTLTSPPTSHGPRRRSRPGTCSSSRSTIRLSARSSRSTSTWPSRPI